MSETPDIVERLIRLKPLVANHAINAQYAPAIIDEAAAEITRLLAALEADKERCAKVADEYERSNDRPGHYIGSGVAKAIATAIRALPPPADGEKK